MKEKRKKSVVEMVGEEVVSVEVGRERGGRGIGRAVFT